MNRQLFLRAAATAVRNVELGKAKFMLADAERSTSDRKEFALQTMTLSAAVSIKEGKPADAARTFTKMLHAHPFCCVDDPTFLANLAVVFALNGASDKSRIVLSMIPSEHAVYKDQAEVWLRDLNVSSASAVEADEAENDNFEDEEALIVSVKKQLASALRLIRRGDNNSERSMARAKLKLLDARQKCASFGGERTKAIANLQHRVDVALVRCVVLC